VGGTLGAILTGVFADPAVNGVLSSMNLMDGLVMNQLKACALTIVLSVVATTIIALIVKFTIGLRPTQDEEREGLDTADHGEEGYILE